MDSLAAATTAAQEGNEQQQQKSQNDDDNNKNNDKENHKNENSQAQAQAQQQHDDNDSDKDGYFAGDIVLTTFGIGVILQVIYDSSSTTTTIKSNNNNNNNANNTNNNYAIQFYKTTLWRIPGKSMSASATAFLRPDTMIRRMPAAPGMTTTCSSSSLVVVPTTTTTTEQNGTNSNNNSTTKEEEEQQQQQEQVTVMVHGYSISNNVYFVAPTATTTANNNNNNNNNNVEVLLAQVSPKDFQKMAPCAKFYPLLVDLCRRGNEASLALQSTLTSPKAKQISRMLQRGANKLQQETQKTLDTVTTTLEKDFMEKEGETNDDEDETNRGGTTDTTKNDSVQKLKKVQSMIETNLPSQEEIKSIYEMLRDEELTVLLQKGKERLDQLVQRDIPEATQTILQEAGISIVENPNNTDSTSNVNHSVAAAATSAIQTAVMESRQKALTALQDLLSQPIDDILKDENDNDDRDDNDDDDGVQGKSDSLQSHFTEMFESLSLAAKTDRSLDSIFETINVKTTQWQAVTGRLLATKSASLFSEGANRLKDRAAMLFGNGGGKNNMFLFGGAGGGAAATRLLTKAFTEGDAAVARLKSIELGDAVRSRLITAIEVRSGSQGGLDGIIAGALSSITLNDNDNDNDDRDGSSSSNSNNAQKIRDMLAMLQKTATTTTQNAHETLLSVLSRQSQYRDAVLLKIEQALCSLEAQFGSDIMTARDIAALTDGSGDGGGFNTAALFEPIAKRAAVEIETHLNQVESTLGKTTDDPTIRNVLARVKKLISGEMTLQGLLDETVDILNDDRVVEAGKSFIGSGEQVLDALEGTLGKVSGGSGSGGGGGSGGGSGGDGGPNKNKMIQDALQVAEKAGITKEVVMQKMESLDINQILDTAETAVSDEKARRDLISSATDSALDFLLRILPSLPVPPFDGVRDGLVYHLSNLSMEGFRLKKEDIIVEIAGIRAKKQPKPKEKKQSSASTVPPLAGKPPSRSSSRISTKRGQSFQDNNNNNNSNNANMDITPSNSMDEEGESVDGGGGGEIVKHVKATELLIIDVVNISAVLDDAVWKFEQTYLPYLKGSGKANIKCRDGSIRLQFELRRRRKVDPANKGAYTKEWEPVLCLHDRTCRIGEIELILQGEGKLTWIFNKLVTFFQAPLRDYVVKTIVNVLTNQSGVILEKLNSTLANYWGLILKTAKLSMDDLVEADEAVVMSKIEADRADEVELVWRERVPLGMNLLLNDESGQLKVVDFPRGSQARKVAAERGLDADLFKGAAIIAVNGAYYDDQDELLDALTDPGRPKSISFHLADTADAARIQEWIGESKGSSSSAAEETAAMEKAVPFSVRNVTIGDEGDIGIQFSSSFDNFCFVVTNFKRAPSGMMLLGEKTRSIEINDMLAYINGSLALGEGGVGQQKALDLFKVAGSARPITFGFIKPYLFREVLKKSDSDMSQVGGPQELVFREKEITPSKSDSTAAGSSSSSKVILLDSFNDVNGMAEAGGVLIGDHLVFVNGFPVGAGCQLYDDPTIRDLHDVMVMLKNKKYYPAALTFARPNKNARSRWGVGVGVSGGMGSSSSINLDNAETFCITADSFRQLGCIFATGPDGTSVVVNDICAIAGPIQEQLRAKYDSQILGGGGGERGGGGLAIEAVDGEIVPSYANCSMIEKVLQRSWSEKGQVELMLCDLVRKEWARTLE